MADKRAQKIISLEERERGLQFNFRSLWQSTADIMYPTENQIIDKTTPGERKTDAIMDTTAITESQNMASGLAQNLIPAGQKFFALRPTDRNLSNTETVKRYLGQVTETVHDELFASNFMLQFTNTLRSLVVFGTGNIFSEFRTQLNFTDYAIGTYQFLENSLKLVDTMILKFPLTALQATEEFESPGAEVVKAMTKEESKNDIFWFIHVVRPRKVRNLNFSDNLNMPFESLFVSIKDIEVVEEGGFDEFPYHTPRWLKASSEKYGRGVGTENLPQVNVLNRQVGDLVECGNKWNRPPREILESFEGEVDVTPDANNWVTEIGSIRAIDDGLKGNFPITKDIIEMQRQIVKDAFFSSAFAPLTDLTGDRRTVPEIRQRVQESFKKIGSPIGRIQTELLTPLVTRSVLLLLRNGRIPTPPPELTSFEIEYVGPLSLALKSSEVEAAQQWIGIVGEMEAINPGSIDYIDFGSVIPRMARTFGVNEEDIATTEEVEAKQAQRAALLQEQRDLEAAKVAGPAYQAATQAPQPGSPAEALV